MKKKTPEIRAKELFQLVYGKESIWTYQYLMLPTQEGWLKLGKLVLRLEKRIQRK